mgnify:CR=1 FL=1
MKKRGGGYSKFIERKKTEKERGKKEEEICSV